MPSYRTHAECSEEVDRPRGVTVEAYEYKKLVTTHHTTLDRVGNVALGAEWKRRAA